MLIMDKLQELWNSLGFDGYVLLACMLFFVYYLVRTIYKTVVICSRNKDGDPGRREGVSVIITSSNRDWELRENLEYFLTQDHPEYEVIVVDECSEDDTQDTLSELQQKYPHLRTTRIFPETKFRNTKKIAIHIGILAAQYDILLFSEIDSRPDTQNWVRDMQACFNENTAVVLGYANYAAGGGRNMRRFFRFMRFLKMILFVKGGCFVLGDGHNMGYRKKYYLEEKGFSRNTHSYIGYDNEMVKALSARGGTQVSKKDSTFVTINDTNKKTWKGDYTYYYENKRKWPISAVLKSDLDYYVRFFFYLMSIYLICKKVLILYIMPGIALLFVMEMIATSIGIRNLKQKKLFLSSVVAGFIGFLYRWYFNMYSTFTRKKWR